MDAQHLRPGYLLLTAQEAWATVVALRIEASDLRAWNLSVAEFETFFVTGAEADDAVWVHNCPSPSPALKGDPYSPAEVNKRQSDLRRELGTGNNNPDSPIGEVNQSPSGTIQGGGVKGDLKGGTQSGITSDGGRLRNDNTSIHSDGFGSNPSRRR